MIIVVYAFAVLFPFAAIGWFVERIVRKDDNQELNASIDRYNEINNALREQNDDLTHTLQDEEREHTACELDLDEAEMELLECADGIEGYVKTVAEQDAKIVAQAEFICEQGDQITALEDEIIDLRISAAGRTKIPKKSRKAS